MLIKNACDLIGNTPVLELNTSYSNKTKIYAKLECFNLTGSVKDRPVYQIIKDLYDTKKIDSNTTIIEYTSGNTGISLSAMSNIFNNRIIIVMPKTMSEMRRRMIANYGAELVLADGGMQGAKDKAYEILNSMKNAIMLNQFGSESNYKSHYKTAKEILEDVEDVEAVVCGIGTGGTITGLSKYFKLHNKDIKIFGVEPSESPLLTKNESGPHKIQGIGANFVPPLVDKSLIDEIITIPSDKAIEYQKILIKKEGVSLGISSGAALCGAIEVSKKYNFKKILIICPDSGDRYL
ncbi:MAG: cysteine synthase family protein [Erysipelotrichales bacterium]|nr:cysteine synthase family protein [Erysipelotrichales bacterium]